MPSDGGGRTDGELRDMRRRMPTSGEVHYLTDLYRSSKSQQGLSKKTRRKTITGRSNAAFFLTSLETPRMHGELKPYSRAYKRGHAYNRGTPKKSDTSQSRQYRDSVKHRGATTERQS
jgi:hypothetical protein